METLEKFTKEKNQIQLSNDNMSCSLMTSSSWSRFKQRIQNIEILERKRKIRRHRTEERFTLTEER